MASLRGLQQMLKTGVVEVKFARRRPKANQGPSRRMLATNSELLLSSLEGAVAFKFNPPKQSPKYNPTSHNLVIAYDLLKLNYRAIPSDAASVVSFKPVTNEEELKDFWVFFNKTLAPMSVGDKEKFINS